MMFAKGDLVYVPQSVILYGTEQNSLTINKKPSLALFVTYAEEGFARVLLNGKQWLIKDKELYLSEQKESINAC